MKKRIFTFIEPHLTGGDCTVRIAENQIMKYMHTRQENEERFKTVSDEHLLDYFLTSHWCKEEKEKESKQDKISLSDIKLYFECSICNAAEVGYVSECIYNGAPFCTDCGEEMDLVKSEIKS